MDVFVLSYNSIIASILCDELLADRSFAARSRRFTATDTSELPQSSHSIPCSEAPSSTKIDPLECGRVAFEPRVTGLDTAAEDALDDVFSPDASSVAYTSTSASCIELPSSSKTYGDAAAAGSIAPVKSISH